jgi:hypothetical protein
MQKNSLAKQFLGNNGGRILMLHREMLQTTLPLQGTRLRSKMTTWTTQIIAAPITYEKLEGKQRQWNQKTHPTDSAIIASRYSHTQ